MFNPLNFNINPRFKHFDFPREHLPTVVVDTLADRKPLTVLEVGVEYGGYLDIYYPQFEPHVEKFYLVDLWQTEGNQIILLGDWNSDFEDVNRWMRRLGLQNTICEQHGYEAPVTYHRSNSLPIDGIYSSFNLPAEKSGFLAFLRLSGDHR